MTTCDVDAVASELARWGRIGRSMPPSWDGAADSVPVCGQEGQRVGRILPGRGFYLDSDLKSLGITKGIRNVYERSPAHRLVELLKDERAAITTYDGIISARAGGLADDVACSKLSLTTVASAWSSMWRQGGLPAAGTYTNIPTSAAPDHTATGALSFGMTVPSAPNKKYLLTFGYTSTSALQIVMLTDLLMSAGNILTTINTSQAITSTTLTRYTTGAGVMMTFEVTTAIGTTASNLTVTYTNQAGTASQSTGAQAILVSTIAGRLIPVGLGPFMQLASGDYGIRAVSAAICSAAMTTGIIALNLYKPLMFVPGIAANIFVQRDSTTNIDGLAELVQTVTPTLPCLNVYLLANTTSSGVLLMQMQTATG